MGLYEMRRRQRIGGRNRMASYGLAHGTQHSAGLPLAQAHTRSHPRYWKGLDGWLRPTEDTPPGISVIGPAASQNGRPLPTHSSMFAAFAVSYDAVGGRWLPLAAVAAAVCLGSVGVIKSHRSGNGGCKRKHGAERAGYLTAGRPPAEIAGTTFPSMRG